MKGQVYTLDAIRAATWWLSSVLMLVLLGACGGGDDFAGASQLQISSQPDSIDALAGGDAAFNVVASGERVAYQWQRSTDEGSSWSDIAGATSATLHVTKLQPGDDQHQFRVTLTDAGGFQLVSTPAILGVTATLRPALIRIHPDDQSVADGEEAVYTVTAAGTSLCYQWQSSGDGQTWSDLPGAGGNTLKFSASVRDDGRRYRVIVANGTGSVTSEAASLSVAADASLAAVAVAPSISRQPGSITVVAPQPWTFSVATSGTPAPTYQWQLSTNGGVSYANIALATGPTYATPATKTTDSGRKYRVRVSNSAGAVISAAATLTVAASPQAPAIATQPASKAVVAGSKVTFTVGATGAPSPTLQWQVSSDGVTYANIVGATSASYTTPTTVAADSGKRFRAVVTNSAGRTISRAAILSVSASGRLLYVSEFNPATTQGYQIALSTGALAEATGSPYLFGFGQLVIHPSGAFAYLNLGNPGITGFQVAASGKLTTIAGSTFSNGAQLVGGLAIHPNGRFVYALRRTDSKLEGFSVDANSGALKPLSSSPYEVITLAFNSMVFGPGGKFLYALSTDSSIAKAQLHVYAVNASTGKLSVVSGSPFALPNSLYNSEGSVLFHPSGKFAYVFNSANQVIAFAIDPTAGSLSQIPGSPFLINSPNSSGFTYATFAAGGKFLYFAPHRQTSPPAGTKRIFGFSVNASTGALVPLSGNPLGTTNGCGLIAAGSSLLVQGGIGTSSGATSLSVNPDTGALTILSSAAFSGGGCDMYRNPSGRLYYSVGIQESIAGFTVNPTTGEITSLAGSPWVTTGIPSQLVFR